MIDTNYWRIRCFCILLSFKGDYRNQNLHLYIER
uniref:Uncharacterized protein n=1 Tax=Rhizophora mucronata TaxID=61149 RepID=A0A2P2PSB8_RHIMU